MRTLYEIYEGARDGNKPTHDECYYAMLALGALLHFSDREVADLCGAIKEAKPSVALRATMTSGDNYKRRTDAFGKAPKDWLGNEVPESPEYQKRRATAFKVLEAATGITKESLS